MPRCPGLGLIPAAFSSEGRSLSVLRMFACLKRTLIYSVDDFSLGTIETLRLMQLSLLVQLAGGLMW